MHGIWSGYQVNWKLIEVHKNRIQWWNNMGKVAVWDKQYNQQRDIK